MSTGPSPKLSAFRDCWEASMTFEEALGCAGLSEKPDAVIEVLRNYWNTLERNFSAGCRAEETLNA